MDKRTELSVYYGENLLFLDPAEDFDRCIVGIGVSCGHDAVVIYDTDKIIDVLMSQNMSQEDAYEYMEYNILGAYMGEHTPMFLMKD
jgi:hypothetical protein